MYVFGGTQGGKTGILAPFQPLVGPQSSTYPEYSNSFVRCLLGNSEPEEEGRGIYAPATDLNLLMDATIYPWGVYSWQEQTKDWSKDHD